MLFWVSSIHVFFIFYLHLFSAIEHVSRGKVLKKYNHYYYCYYYYYYYCFGTKYMFWFLYITRGRILDQGGNIPGVPRGGVQT